MKVSGPVGDVVDFVETVVDKAAEAAPQVTFFGKKSLLGTIGLGLGLLSPLTAWHAVAVGIGLGWAADRRDASPGGRLRQIHRLEQEKKIDTTEANRQRRRALDDLLIAKRPSVAVRIDILMDCVERGYVRRTLGEEYRRQLAERL